MTDHPRGDASPDTVALHALIGDALDTYAADHGNEARCDDEAIAAAVEAITSAYLLTPRGEIHPGEFRYNLAFHVLDDVARLDQAHATARECFYASAAQAGLTLLELPRLTRGLDTREGATFVLTANARLIDQGPAALTPIPPKDVTP